ncbi:hypothetical protein [Streptococcus plurextorum]|uniref:hypothetical protein n=1 Tax=Streptococcus plurextorum TaxID=456876 RepID=UPI000427CFAE|nr:hypothetical protein [Streptococcus plurextorum]
MVQSIQTILESFISQLSSDSSSYIVQPDKDFTRSRKCSFQQMVSAILNMGGQTLSKELINQDFPISKAAFVQNQYKIKHQAFKKLFKNFTQAILPKTELTILAVDGLDIHIPVIPEDTASHFPSKLGGKAYNLLHLDALFDLESELYCDA